MFLASFNMKYDKQIKQAVLDILDEIRDEKESKDESETESESDEHLKSKQGQELYFTTL